MTPSTASRALRRLVMDGRLVLAEAGQGRRAHAYSLARVEEWSRTRVRDLVIHAGDTQATPGGSHFSGVTREELLTMIGARLAHAAHDLWVEPVCSGRGGLGRHVERTAAALVDIRNHYLYNVDSLVRQTGYTPHRISVHLRPLPDCYDAAARSLGTVGTRARRIAGYTAERAAWNAWLTELEILRAPHGSVRALFGTRPGPRYPRTATGLPDHAAARRHAAAA